MKSVLGAMLAVGVICLFSAKVVAGEEGGKKAKGGGGGQEMTLTGKLDKTEKQTGEGDKAKVSVTYTLTNAEGAVVKLPKPKKDDEEKWAALVGKDVKIVGMGSERAGKDGKKQVSIRTVTSIEEAAGEGGAEAPAEGGAGADLE